MTREDIKTINDIVHKTIYGFFDICGDEETPMTDKDKLLLEVNKAVCNNIKDLEQEPCEDAISRREAIRMFMYNYKGERIPDYDCDNFPVQIAMKTVKEILRNAPPVNPQPKTGHWIIHGEPPINVIECSECGQKYHNHYCQPLAHFCSMCGCRMVEPQERSDKG